MKQICLTILAMCLVAVIVIAATNEVTSVNVVGYVKTSIPTSGNYTMISIPFDPIGGVTNTLQGVFGTNRLTQHPSIGSLADRLYKFTGAGYDVFYQRTNGLFYVVGASTPTNIDVLAGDTFWIQQPAASNQVKQIVLMGDVVDVATQLTDMVSSYQMLAYPFSSDVNINQTGFRSSSGSASHATIASLADRIYVFTGAGYDVYALNTNGWRASDGFATNALATKVFSMGDGFWYQARSNAWTWAETNKYLSNL